MHTAVGIFIFVYLGMILGGFPGLAMDRTGVALLGALVLIVTGEVAPDQAWDAVDVPTIGLLFGLMVVSAQFRLGGFYAFAARRVAAVSFSPPMLLAVLLAVVAGLSAVLTNDIICLAMTPLLVEGCARRNLNPVPLLLGLACAANIGSAATLIGNPQNMLIGQALSLSFASYLVDAVPAVLLSLFVTWAVLALLYRNRWRLVSPPVSADSPPLNVWQTTKGTIVLTLLIASFLFLPVPREVIALGAAGLLLVSRKMHSREMLGVVDWHLLVLFIGLFVVNDAFRACGALERVFETAQNSGVNLSQPAWLFVTTTVLSNLVSNVPATMLLLPAATHPMSGAILALSSTFAGNLIIVGSIANIIVVEQARLLGVRISWAEHARAGVPVTMLTLIIAGAWLMLRMHL
ncbi:MAG TPA: anion transporter [Candidatus Hydrogenedentes bacterium]|nr:anion transporter [Candidatus Hydrogenedentota bacterium]HQE82728.1 anion transporter [Candidatus Hydrogenedentota bacterium]HQH51705.1 anion transporter [Candidatus Hydrogenedentota bacterium]HQM47206.1 anion transporter [Candidatus Hydrogenedentota bacterium]